MLLFSREIGLTDGEFPTVVLADVQFPQKASRIVFATGMFWGRAEPSATAAAPQKQSLA